MQDKLEEVLDRLDQSDVERLLLSLAKKYNVQLPGGGGGGMQGLGVDDYGERIQAGDDILEGVSCFGTPVRVNMDGVARRTRGLRDD